MCVCNKLTGRRETWRLAIWLYPEPNLSNYILYNSPLQVVFNLILLCSSQPSYMSLPFWSAYKNLIRDTSPPHHNHLITLIMLFDAQHAWSFELCSLIHSSQISSLFVLNIFILKHYEFVFNLQYWPHFTST